MTIFKLTARRRHTVAGIDFISPPGWYKGTHRLEDGKTVRELIAECATPRQTLIDTLKNALVQDEPPADAA